MHIGGTLILQTISGGYNYALLDGNATGRRLEIEYSQSWHKHIGATVNFWYAEGVAKEVLVWHDYGQRIVKDGRNSGFGIDPSIDFSMLKSRQQDLTLQLGLTIGKGGNGRMESTL
ncbi:MAG: hypothetical protein JWQ96_242 [Segetibacter sp.]|nr:hypothetical protein [Segetibacter sp.]